MSIRLAGKAGWLALMIVALLVVGAACSGGEDGPGENGAGAEGAAAESDNSGDNGDGDENGEEGEGDEEGEDEEEAVPVEIVTLERGRIEAVLRFSTSLEAESDIQVLSEAARRVTRLMVEEGDVVRPGQVLVRLQDEEQKTNLARVDSQLQKARREYERQTNLYEQQLISQEAYNEATYNLEQLELALQDARRELGYTEVRAPIGGTITERLVNLGDHVTVNQRLFDIVDFDSLVARVFVPEKELSRLRVGQEARIYADAAGGGERRGRVDRIAPRVDPRSGTVKVTVAIPPGEGLLPGMYATVELITEVHEDAVLVPKKALVYDADQLFVFRLKDDEKVERLLVKPALEDRTNIEPAGVLRAGDRIVAAGQASLKDGSLVRPVRTGGERAADAGKTLGPDAEAAEEAAE